MHGNVSVNYQLSAKLTYVYVIFSPALKPELLPITNNKFCCYFLHLCYSKW